MKKIFTGFIALLMCLSVVFGFAGCGEQGEDGVITITLGVLPDTTERNIAKSFADAFNKKQDKILVKLKTINDYAVTIAKWNAAGILPDAFFVLDTYSAFFADAGLLEPLTPYIEKDGLDMSVYFESIIKMASPLKDNQMYFVPRDYNKIVMIVNKDMFEAAGVALPPKEGCTWEELENICAQLKVAMQSDLNPEKGIKKGSYPISLGATNAVVFQSFIASYGGSLIKDGKPNFDDEKTLKGLRAIRKFKENDYASWSSTYSAFEVSESAIGFTVAPDMPTYKGLDLNIEFYPMPGFTAEGTSSKAVFGCTGYGMNAKSKYKNETWEFLKYIFSQEGQEVFSGTGACVPVIKSIAYDPNATWRKQIFQDANLDAFVMYPERDTQATYLVGSGVPENKHKALYDLFSNLCSGAVSKDYNGYGNESAYVSYANSQITYTLG